MSKLRRNRTARITIELDLSKPDLAGVMHGSGTSRSFDGWLELTAVMDAAETDARLAAGGTARRAAERRQAVALSVRAA